MRREKCPIQNRINACIVLLSLATKNFNLYSVASQERNQMLSFKNQVTQGTNEVHWLFWERKSRRTWVEYEMHNNQKGEKVVALLHG